MPDTGDYIVIALMILASAPALYSIRSSCAHITASCSVGVGRHTWTLRIERPANVHHA